MYRDILRNQHATRNLDDVRQMFDAAEAAPTLPDIVPKGEYIAHWTGITVDHASTGNGRVVLAFKVVDGEYAGKHLWDDLYVTPKAAPYAKRELAKLALHSSADWSKPVPHWVRCSVHVVVEIDDNGKARNKVANFTVIKFDPEKPHPFAPPDDSVANDSQPSHGMESDGGNEA